MNNHHTTPKFRVWDKNFKRVCQVDFIDCQRQIATYHISELAIVTNPIKKIILMQSRGLEEMASTLCRWSVFN